MPNWTHSDPQGLQERFEAAIQRSRSFGWRTGPLEQRGAELRALTMGTALVAWRACDRREFITSEYTVYDFPPVEEWPTVQHRQAAARVLDTLTLLADGNKPTAPNFITAGGLSPQNLNVEGWPILVAKIAAHAIWAFAACYIAERYEDTIDRFLGRKDAGEKMLAAQADAVKVIENHADQEVKMGQTLPYTPQENAVLDKLLQTQQAFAAKKDAPKDNLPSLGQTSFSVGTLLILGMVAYFALKGRS